jgi:hypothetical protein
MTTYTIDPAAIARASEAPGYGCMKIPSARDLSAALDVARGLFPDDHVFSLCSGITIALDRSRDAITDEALRSWYILTPNEEGGVDALALDLERITSRGFDAAVKALDDRSLDGWRNQQSWETSGPIDGLAGVPSRSSAVSTALHLGPGVRVFVVRDTALDAPDDRIPCFGKSDVRQFLLDVGFYEPNTWKHAFLHRAAEVVGLKGPDSFVGFFDGLETDTAERLIALANDAERALPGNAAFDTLRNRWYEEFVAYGVGLANAGEITMTEQEIRDYAGVGPAANFDGSFAEGQCPEEAFDNDREYWDE